MHLLYLSLASPRTVHRHIRAHTVHRAGFCVDGLEKEAFWQSAVYGWSRSNCDYAYPAELGEVRGRGRGEVRGRGRGRGALIATTPTTPTLRSQASK